MKLEKADRALETGQFEVALTYLKEAPVPSNETEELVLRVLKVRSLLGAGSFQVALNECNSFLAWKPTFARV